MTEEHPIRGARPSGQVAGLKLEEIRARLTSTNPARVAAAGHAFNDASAKLVTARDEIDAAITYIGARWKGPAASEAIGALRKLKASADELSIKGGKTGKALQTYGEKILPWYRSHLPDKGFIRDGGDDEYAQQIMRRLNGRIAQTNDVFPESLTYYPTPLGKDASATSASHSLDSATAAGPGGTGGGSGSGHPLGPSAGGEASPEGPTGSTQGAGSGGGTELASFTPDGRAGMPSAPGAGISQGGATGLGAGGLGAGSAGPGGLLGPGMAPGGTGSGAMRSSGASAPRGGSGAKPGMPWVHGAPVGVGSGAGEGQERERRTWLAEDPEIWTDDTAVAPPVIGGDEQPSHDTSDVPSDTRNGTAEPGADAITEAGEDEPAVMLDIAELEAELEAELGLEIPGPETEDDGSAGQQLDPALGGSGDGVWSDNDRHDRPRSGNPPASP